MNRSWTNYLLNLTNIFLSIIQTIQYALYAALFEQISRELSVTLPRLFVSCLCITLLMQHLNNFSKKKIVYSKVKLKKKKHILIINFFYCSNIWTCIVFKTNVNVFKSLLTMLTKNSKQCKYRKQSFSRQCKQLTSFSNSTRLIPTGKLYYALFIVHLLAGIRLNWLCVTIGRPCENSQPRHARHVKFIKDEKWETGRQLLGHKWNFKPMATRPLLKTKSSSSSSSGNFGIYLTVRISYQQTPGIKMLKFS